MTAGEFGEGLFHAVAGVAREQLQVGVSCGFAHLQKHIAARWGNPTKIFAARVACCVLRQVAGGRQPSLLILLFFLILIPPGLRLPPRSTNEIKIKKKIKSKNGILAGGFNRTFSVGSLDGTSISQHHPGTLFP